MAHVSRIRGAVKGSLCAGTLAVSNVGIFFFKTFCLIQMPNLNQDYCILPNT